MGAASQNLTPVTLELGGKSPVVIAPGFPIGHAVQRVLAGKLLNAGQTCIAPDYALVPRTQVPAFVEATKRQAQVDVSRRDSMIQTIAASSTHGSTSVSPDTPIRRAVQGRKSCRCLSVQSVMPASIGLAPASGDQPIAGPGPDARRNLRAAVAGNSIR